MRRVALKGLWLRRGRATLTALAVVLGVAMVCGTYVLTDTISKAFDSIFATGASKTSAVITGKEVVSGSTSGAATVPQSLVVKVRGVDGVQAAAGGIEGTGTADQIRLIGSDGKALGGENAPKFGFGFEPSATRFNPLNLVEGRWAGGDGQVVIDKGTADKEHLELGSSVGVAARGTRQTFKVVGIAKYGDVNSLGGATIGVFDLPVAQRLLDKAGQVDSIYVAASPGVSPKEVVARLKPVVPASASVRTAADQAAQDSKDIKDATSFIQYFLLAFALIALGVGSFVIYNTLSITVAQRIRELATLRTLGASRKQVRRSVLLEGLAIGIIASVVGLVLGWFLAKGLNALFVALGIDLPKTDEVLRTRTIVVSLLVGIVVTVLASFSPARRATSIPPVAALQEGATLPPRLGARRPIIPGIVLGIALALLLVGAFGSLSIGLSLALIGGGTLLTFVGVGMVAHRVVRPLARVLGVYARRAGAAGKLAGENATRNPQRTATTAAALMIGLALVTLVATLGQGLRVSDRKALEGAVKADHVVTADNGFDPIPSTVGKAVAKIPGAQAYPVRYDRGKAFGDDVSVNGLPPNANEAITVRVSGGSAEPGAGEALVEKGWAKDHGLKVGSQFKLTTPSGRKLQLKVSAYQVRTSVEKIDPLLGRVLISQATFDQAFPRPNDQYVFTIGASQQQLDQAISGFPSAEASTRTTWVDDRVKGVDTLLNLLYVLLALSVVVSLFGMVNTLVLSVFERTREIGMLRAVGMSRRQVRRMVRQESVITALIGAALGLPLGIALAALISSALSSEGLGFSLPVGSLVVFTIVAMFAGVLAAIAPARRAARLNVLNALQYE
jgi:putative ABC transport system permease protein